MFRSAGIPNGGSGWVRCGFPSGTIYNQNRGVYHMSRIRTSLLLSAGIPNGTLRMLRCGFPSADSCRRRLRVVFCQFAMLRSVGIPNGSSGQIRPEIPCRHQSIRHVSLRWYSERRLGMGSLWISIRNHIQSKPRGVSHVAHPHQSVAFRWHSERYFENSSLWISIS